MLFSEPKIPQLRVEQPARASALCFSALQRAENSSIQARVHRGRWASLSFSALQRAENSSMRPRAGAHRDHPSFQCSSASRKFLNADERPIPRHVIRFQCSSASRKFLNRAARLDHGASDAPFQCSSASRKFLNSYGLVRCMSAERSFSALQRAENSSIVAGEAGHTPLGRFSALQRAENSSILLQQIRSSGGSAFQCSSASRKFLNCARARGDAWRQRRFSALQRAENSSIRAARADETRAGARVSVLFSEPKIPQ